MSRSTTKLFKTLLSVLHYSGAGSVMAPFTRGEGVIFTLHQVRPDAPRAFEPNRLLSITPEFLERTVKEVIAAGFDLVSLDEAHDRLAAGPGGRPPFACFTFDDGYRDNREHAYPILERHRVPFTIYVPTDYADGNGELWWLALEQVIRESTSVSVPMEGSRSFACRTPAAKQAVFDTIYWWLRALPEQRARAVVRALAAEIGLDMGALCRSLIMSWEEIRALARDPLVTVGAHSRSHLALSKLPAGEAQAEIAASVARIERELGRPCRHFSFPYGDEASAGPREFALAADVGVATAVTTRKGVLGREHAGALTALPRVSLNGEYQAARYVRVFLSGAPFALWNAFSRKMPTHRAVRVHS